MDHLFGLTTTLMVLTIIRSTWSLENIEISTAPSSPSFTSNTKHNLDGNMLTDSVEHFLPESTNVRKTEPQTELQGYISQQMVPVYPAQNAGGYFYPGINPNTALSTASNDVEQGSYYFSSVLPAAQMGFEVLRQYFLYFLVRHLVFKVIKIFNLVLDIRDVLITDEISNYLTKAALQAALRLFTKVGLYLVGGAGLLVIGGIFTTLLCYFTPICTISFNGFDFQKALNKDTMRALMTPEKIATAAALVQDAIGKYQRLQRAVS